MNIAKKEEILNILEKESLAYIATTNNHYVDNAVICFANNGLSLYFGCYNDTLKARNISNNPHVALAVSILQIHGIARLIPYESKEYAEKIRYYGKKHPQYLHVFDKENNDLFEVNPQVIWLYNSSKGEMNRDVYIIDQEYYNKLQPYIAKDVYNFKKGKHPDKA